MTGYRLRWLMFMISSAVDSDPQKMKPPSEVKIIVGIEVFSGVVYLVNFVALLSMEISIMSLVLCCLSFIIAYGLWRVQKWAWLISFLLSVFGVISGIVVLAISGLYESSIFGRLPMIIIDLLVIGMLLSKDVRVAFKI